MFGLTGCGLGKGTRVISSIDGAKLYEAKCNGTGRTIGDCYSQASDVCGGEFEIVDKDESSGVVTTSPGNVISTRNRAIIFKCS